MNIPTRITVVRILCIPILLIVWYLPALGTFEWGSTKSLLMTSLFVLLSLTDWLDGYIARKYNMITDLGKFLDPIADKVLVFTIYLLLLHTSLEPVSVILMLTREFIVATIRMDAASKNFVMAADTTGKLKTVMQMISLTLLLLNIQQLHQGVYYFVYGIYYLAVVLTMSSGYNYIRIYMEQMKRGRKDG